MAAHRTVEVFMKRSQRAFTLVELLVVVAIIGILISILVPTLTNTHRVAGITSCASQMRQIALAINNFAQDNRDRLFQSSQANPAAAHGSTNIMKGMDGMSL